MLILVVFLLLIALSHTVVSLSLYENKVTVAGVVAGLSASAIVLLPLSIKINTFRLIEQLARVEVIQTVCTYQIIESLAVMMVTMKTMKNHFEHRDQGARINLVHFPNGLALGLIFLGTNGLCHVLHQWSYWLVAAMVTSVTAILLLAGIGVLRAVMKNWLNRLELKIAINFFQIIVAMFLPLLLSQQEVRQSAFEMEWVKSGLVLAGMVVLAGAGWIMNKNHFNFFKKSA